MSVGSRDGGRQEELWIAHGQGPKSPGHPFYARLNGLLKDDGFDRFAEGLCAPFFKAGGRPSIAPGVYFRMLFVGFFEGLGSERAIAWRCADSLSLRDFLGMGLSGSTPDHSTLSVWRKRLDLEVYQEVFSRVLALVDGHGLLDGGVLGVDSTTVEANAAMKSIVRKDTREGYRDFVDRLAAEAGETIETAAQRQRFDRKRKGKTTSNKDWESPVDPDARVAKMKDGRTHMAYKAEHAVDLQSSVIVCGRVTPADQGDAKTLVDTVQTSRQILSDVAEDKQVLSTVADKGYHSKANIKELNWDLGVATYIPEPERNTRYRWHGDERARAEFHGNRQRCGRDHGKALGRKRANLVERSFAHVCETGGLRRFHTRGLDNARKRYLVQVAAYNLCVLMRARYGHGTPRGAAENRLLDLFIALFARILIHLALSDS